MISVGACLEQTKLAESWHVLYAGLRRLIDDLHVHIHLENNVLFPRFLDKC